MSEAVKRPNRTKVLYGGTLCARLEKPGETEVQQEKWRAKVLASGRMAVVFPTQESLDGFVATAKMQEADRKRRAEYQKLVDFVMRQYLAGELMVRPAPDSSVGSAW
jgi:hypothetical protein